MTSDKRKLAKEEKTVSEMIRLFCRKHHKPEDAGICPDCSELLDYAKIRLEKCPFGEEKRPCSKCLIHCYTPEMRKRIIEVMRYSGPRMLLHHPVLALSHMRSRGPKHKNKK